LDQTFRVREFLTVINDPFAILTWINGTGEDTGKCPRTNSSSSKPSKLSKSNALNITSAELGYELEQTILRVLSKYPESLCLEYFLFASKFKEHAASMRPLYDSGFQIPNEITHALKFNFWTLEDRDILHKKFLQLTDNDENLHLKSDLITDLVFMYLFIANTTTINNNFDIGFQLAKQVVDNHVLGHAMLGMCYELGFGTTADKTLATQHYHTFFDDLVNKKQIKFSNTWSTNDPCIFLDRPTEYAHRQKVLENIQRVVKVELFNTVALEYYHEHANSKSLLYNELEYRGEGYVIGCAQKVQPEAKVTRNQTTFMGQLSGNVITSNIVYFNGYSNNSNCNEHVVRTNQIFLDGGKCVATSSESNSSTNFITPTYKINDS
jgi:hypothetical protein